MGSVLLLAGLLLAMSLALLAPPALAGGKGKGPWGCNALNQTTINDLAADGDPDDFVLILHHDSGGTVSSQTVNIPNSLLIQGGWRPIDTSPGVECGGWNPDQILADLDQADDYFTYIPGLISHMPGPSLNLNLNGGKTVTIQNVRLDGSHITGLITNSSELRLENVIIENNSSDAGLSLQIVNGSRLVISNSLFIANTNTNRELGGGFEIEVFRNSQVIIHNSQFVSNESYESGGGYIELSNSSSVIVRNSLFRDNQASFRGGGLRIGAAFGGGRVELSNNVFVGNSAASSGGGLYLLDIGLAVTMTNNLIVRNSIASDLGAGIYVEHGPLVNILHTTIADSGQNPKHGIYVNNADVTLRNSIIANHLIGIERSVGAVVEDYNLYYGNTTHRSGVTKGPHTLDGLNPNFVNLANDEYHLGPGSAALNAALNLGITTDYEGEPRPQLGGPDIGADERAPLLTETFKLLSGGGVLSVSHSIVAVDGDTIVVGRPLEDTAAGTDAGAVYILRRSGAGWSREARLIASDAAAEDNFGADVAVSGNTVLIGAYLNDDAGSGSGSAYVFQRSGVTWSQQAKLVASDAAANDQFGSLVDISGDTMLIGATYDDVGTAVDAGSAYIFQRSGSQWGQNCAGASLVCRQSQKLTASDAAAGDRFGDAVAISGETAIVGALFNDVAGADSGSAYIFQRNGATWSQHAKLTAGDGAAGDRFGDAVDIEGETVAIGSYFDDGVGVNSGSVYIFQRSGAGWSQQAKLTASDGHHVDTFGNKVALSGDTLVITANAEDDAGIDSGAAYIFKRSGTTWNQQSKLVASDAATYELFGYRAAVSGERIVVGAVTDNNYNAPGQVYVFGPAGAPGGGSVYLPAVIKN